MKRLMLVLIDLTGYMVDKSDALSYPYLKVAI